MRATKLAVIGLVALTTVAGAQTPDSGVSRRGGPPRQRGGGPPGRPALEGRVRQALAEAVKRQLSLDDQQMRQLQRTDEKFDIERRRIGLDEREARQTIRAAIEDSASTDNAKIEAAMRRLLNVQRQRVDLLEAEQKDLSAFLTAKQRAQYFALREQVTRRLMEFQQRGRDGGSGGPGTRGRRPPP